MLWWEKASTDEKLAQIQGGIELHLTASEIATNCRVNVSTLKTFAYRHGLSFTYEDRGERQRAWMLRRVAVRTLHSRFIAGEQVDFWKAA